MATAGEPSYFEKWKSIRTPSGIPYPANWVMVLFNAVGGTIGMAVLLLISTAQAKPVPLNYGGFNIWPAFVPPFAASCMILFALSDLPVAQPRNIIGGYFFSALIGVVLVNIIQPLTGTTPWWGMALSVGLAITVMVFTKTLHPPAAVSAILPFMFVIKDPLWILWPNTLGAIILVIVAVLWVNLHKMRRYPAFWW